MRSTCWLVQDEEWKAMRPVPTEREDDRLVTEQMLNAVCEMKVEERRREAAIARPLAWGLKVARPVASRETSSLGVKGLPAPLMISLAVVFLAGCSKTWNRALFHGPQARWPQGHWVSWGPRTGWGPGTGWGLCLTELWRPRECRSLPHHRPPARSRPGSSQEPHPHPRCGPWSPQQLEDITGPLR